MNEERPQAVDENVSIGRCKWCGTYRYVVNKQEVWHVCRIDLD